MTFGDREILDQVKPWLCVAKTEIIPIVLGGEEVGSAVIQCEWFPAEDDIPGYQLRVALADLTCHISGVKRRVVIERFCVKGAENVWGEPVVLAARVRDPYAYEEARLGG